MSNKLVSVVVPIYNVESYLPACVESILAQTYSNLEIILVDDGSTDGSAKICDSYAQKDKRVSVLHQKNQGAASARKNGIQAAQGEYICFSDADDVIDKDMVQHFVDGIGHCDMITGGCRTIELDGKERNRMDNLPEGIYQTPEQMEEVWANLVTAKGSFKDGFLPFLFTKMYKTLLMREVIEDVDLTLVYAEDRDLLFRYILKCKSIRITHRPLYEYRIRNGSAVLSPHPDMLRNMDALYKSLTKAFEKHPHKDDLMCQLQMFLVSRIHTIPYWMEFHPEARMVRNLYQPHKDLRGKKLVLYGAGAVGRDYYLQIESDKRCEIVLWADKKWKDYKRARYQIDSPEKIKNVEFDYIVIAVKNKKTAEEIKEELVVAGIPENKILWIEPVILELQ